MEKRIKALAKEVIEIVPYDEHWPERYAELEVQLKRIMPRMLAQRISHIGSTAIPGLSAKPIIDIQVEVSDMERIKSDVVPMMEAAGYEFIWRPSMGDEAPYYAWFILRNEQDLRVAHVHMVEPGQASVDRIVFRDYLRHHPEEAARYEALKVQLHAKHPKDRIAYTLGKTELVQELVTKARSEKFRR